jgi:hypothetical protein
LKKFRSASAFWHVMLGRVRLNLGKIQSSSYKVLGYKQLKMQPPREGLENLEKLRATLEENIQKLRKSLAYWQLWEAEYEGLQETVQSLEDGSSPDEMLVACVDMGGDIVNEKGSREICPRSGLLC